MPVPCPPALAAILSLILSPSFPGSGQLSWGLHPCTWFTPTHWAFRCFDLPLFLRFPLLCPPLLFLDSVPFAKMCDDGMIFQVSFQVYCSLLSFLCWECQGHPIDSLHQYPKPTCVSPRTAERMPSTHISSRST